MEFLSNKPLLITDTILRDAHQSQAATRMTLEDMLPACEVLDSIGYYSLECWGGATFDSCLRFLNEDPWERLRQLRAHLPGDIGVLTLEEAAPRFHARLSCRGKTYVYRVWNSETPNVFERRYVCALPQPLDTAAMQRAAAPLCGTHDYTSFCANRRMKKSAVRTVDAITVERLGEEVRLTFSGDGFLYHMVRILTGTLLEVGLGQRDAGTMADILAARDRSAAGATAPARGLILWETRY